MSPSKVSTISFTEFYNIIDGNQRSGKSQHHGINPSTSEELWGVPIGGQQDVDDAVASAEKAFQKYRFVPFEKRKELLQKFCDAYMSHADEMIDLLCKETGKPRQFAEMEVKGVAAFFGYHLTLEIPEDTVEDDEKIMTTRFTPLGVVGAICPW
jgi:acyl-CoA reductase-like NAD-dependent aldehyde dehydrogenase